MALGLPSVNIVFKQEGITAIERGERGIVALVLKDAKALGGHTVYDITDCPAELSEENRAYIVDALKGNTNAPLRVELFVLNQSEEVEKALNYFENTKFDYICSPSFTSEENVEVATWVKAQRDNDGVMVKAVLANVKDDHEGIINFATDNIVTELKTYTTAEFTPRIAGLIAGTSLKIATTYANIPEIISVPYEKKRDTATKVGEGKLVIFKQSGQYRIARGVNSLVTTSEVKGEAFQKIKHFTVNNEYFYMIPVTTIKGTIVGFILRGVLKSNYSTVSREFEDSTKKVPLMFGFDEKFKRFEDKNICYPIVVCEGSKDCIFLKQFYPYVVAVNTSSMGLNAQILINITNKFVLAYDNDKAGREGIERDKKILRSLGAQVTSLELSNLVKDCSDYIKYPDKIPKLKEELWYKLRRVMSF